MEGYKIPSWQETIEDYFRVMSGLVEQDPVSYMRHVRPFLEKLAFLVGAALMPADLFEEVMNQQANFVLRGEDVSIRRVPQDRALGGSEYFRLIWIGYYFQNKIQCSNPKSIESLNKKRLYAYSETLQLAYGLASNMAVHTNNSISSFDVQQQFVHSTIRSFVDYLISYQIVAIPFQLAKLLELNPFKSEKCPIPSLAEMTTFMDDVFKHQVGLPNLLADNPEQTSPWVESLNIVLNKVTLLTGESGTGKTVAGLYKAYQWGQVPGEVVFVTLYRHKAVFLNMLLKGKNPPFHVTYLSKFESSQSETDFLIIDDAHEFKIETLQTLIKRTRSKVLLCANSLPVSRYSDADQIASCFRASPVKLQTNWRLSEQNLCITDRLMSLHIPSPDAIDVLLGELTRHTTESVQLIDYTTREEQREILLDLLANHPNEKIGILFQNSEQVKSAYEHLRENHLDVQCSYTIITSHGIRIQQGAIHYTSARIQLMLYEYASGLEFDVVILPCFCRLATDRDRHQVYTALTRARNMCYLLHGMTESTTTTA